jgi:hypothetical protein
VKVSFSFDAGDAPQQVAGGPQGRAGGDQGVGLGLHPVGFAAQELDGPHDGLAGGAGQRRAVEPAPLAGSHLAQVVAAAHRGLPLADLRAGRRPGRRVAVAGELGDGAGVGRVGLVAPAAGSGVSLDPRRVGDADAASGVGQGGGRRVGVGAGGLQAEVQVGPGGVVVGPGQQRGGSAGVVGEGGLPGPAARAEQAGVGRGLGDVDADVAGRGGAPGVPPLWLINAGSSREGRPGIASEVEGAGGRADIWFPRSWPQPLHAVVPATGLPPTRRAA